MYLRLSQEYANFVKQQRKHILNYLMSFIDVSIQDYQSCEQVQMLLNKYYLTAIQSRCKHITGRDNTPIPKAIYGTYPPPQFNHAFMRNSPLPIMRSDLTQRMLDEVDYYGCSPPPDVLSIWDEWRFEHKIKIDCGCIAEEVEDSFNYWNNPSPNEDINYINSVDDGVFDVLIHHFHVGDAFELEYSDVSINVICQLLIHANIRSNVNKYPIGNLSENRLQSDFIMSRFSANYEDAITVIAHINKAGWFEHGCSARCSWITKDGQVFLDAQMSIMDQQLMYADIYTYCTG
jgi:hypothetical protein